MSFLAGWGPANIAIIATLPRELLFRNAQRPGWIARRKQDKDRPDGPGRPIGFKEL